MASSKFPQATKALLLLVFALAPASLVASATTHRAVGPADVRPRRSLQDPDPPLALSVSVPSPGAVVDSASSDPYVFAVEAGGTSAPFKKMKFQFQSPGSKGVTFEEVGSVDSSAATVENGHELWYASFPPSSAFASGGDGKWSWRVKATDFSGASTTGPWSDFYAAGGYGGAVAVARSMISDLISGAPTLAPKFVRLGFHDCVGGCDGCVDLSDPENAGLDVPIDALSDVVNLLARTEVAPRFGRADVWALAALTAAELTQGRDVVPFPMRHVGRVDCDLNPDAVCPDGCTAKAGPVRALPSASNVTTSSLLHFFSEEFGFGPRETVAIMGAHSIGTAKRTNSGYHAPDGWTFNKEKLSNDYYDLIVGGNGHDSLEGLNDEDIFFTTKWEQESIDNRNKGTPDRIQWFHQKDNTTNPNTGEPKRSDRLMMLNADIALVRDYSEYLDEETGGVGCNFRCCPDDTMPVCPAANLTMWIAAEFKFNNTLWLEEFRDAFDRMLLKGHIMSAHCPPDDEPCLLEAPKGGGEESANIRGRI